MKDLNVGTTYELICRLEGMLHALAEEQGTQGHIFDVAALVAEIRHLDQLRRKIERMTTK